MKSIRLAVVTSLKSVRSLSGLGALVWLALALPAAATSLQLGFTVPSSFNESNRQALLEWNAGPARTYLVQSATNLSPETVWKTEEPVRPTGSVPIRWTAPEVLREQKYYRLILPQPEIYSVEPAFVNSEDPGALLYLIGQSLPTNGSVVINGQNFTVTSFDPNGTWVALSLNGLPPGQPVFGNLLMLDNASNIVATLPLQTPVSFGPELSLEQLQGPPDFPPASPTDGWTRGGGASVGRSAEWTKGGGASVGKSAKGGGASVGMANPGKLNRLGIDDDDDGDGFDPDCTFLAPALMKAKEKANRGRSGGGGGGSGGEGGKKGLNAVNVKLAFSSGELISEETDLVIPGVGLDFVWTRTYRSRTGPTTAQGAGWDFSYNVSLTEQPDGTVLLRPGNGRADTFYSNGTNGWARDEYFVEIRDLNNDGMPDVLFADSGKWLFHPAGSAFGGKLSQIVDRNGNIIRCEYDGDTGQLLNVVDTLDRTNTVAYNAKGLIESVTDFSGRTVHYEYDSGADLIACISPAVIGTPNGNDFPGGKTNRYAYTSGQLEDRLNHNLVSCTDPKGQTWLEITYQATNNPTSLDFDTVDSVLCGTTAHLRRFPQTPTPANQFTSVKAIFRDRAGNVSESFLDSRQREVRGRDYTGRAPNLTAPVTESSNRPVGKLRAEDPDYFETRCEWNEDSLCTRVVSPRGDSIELVYERAFNQNSARSNRRHAGNLRIFREIACCDQDDDDDGLIDSLTTTFEYDPRFGSSSTMRGGTGKIICNYVRRDKTTYSGSLGSMGTARGPRQTTSLDGSYDPAAGLKFRARFPLVNNSLAFVTSATDPRGIVTKDQYDEHGNPRSQQVIANNGGNGVEVRDTKTRHNSRGQLTAITNAPDATGFARVDTFEYYTNGPQKGYLKSCVVDASGLALTESYEYDARGNDIRFINSRGHDSLYAYNALDQLVRSQSPTNLTARCATDFTYDANDNVVESATELRDENDAFVRAIVPKHVFDTLDRCVAVVEQVSASSFVTNIFSYDANDNVVTVYSPLAVSGADPNNLVTFEYDERDLLFREIGAPGLGNSPTNEYAYDGNRNRIRVLRGPNYLRVTSCAFDGFGRPVTITDPLSNVVTYVYDRNDNLVYQRVDAEPNDGPGSAGNLRYHEWRWRYNALDQCIEARTEFFDPATQLPIGDGSSVTIFSNAPNGQLVSSTDDLGRVTTFAYDTAGRPSSSSSPGLKTVVVTLRDAAGNVASVTQTDRSDLPGPTQVFAWTNRYDSLNRWVSSVDNVGNTNRCAYDSLGNVISAVDGRDNETVFAYDDLSRQVATTNYEGLGRGITINTTHVEYNSNSRIVSSTDANTNTTVYAYDSLDRLIQTTEADGTISSLVWSPRSNLIREQDANGTVITNTYDLLDRLVRRDITPGPGVAATTTFETFAYDGVSQLVAATNDATHNEFAYDSLGRNTRGTSGGVGAVVSAHDSMGNRISMTYPSGRVVTYAYNVLDQVTNVSSGPGGLPPTSLASFFYDGERLSAISRANNVNTRIQWNGLVSPPNASGDFGWGQVKGINHQATNNGAVIDRRTFTYDQKQNKTLRAQIAPFYQGGDMTTNVFEYDALDRLSRAINTTGTGATVRMYVLDGNDNRQLVLSNGVAGVYEMDLTIPPADFQMNQYTLTPFVVAPEQYDANGNLIGRTTATAQLQYVYDYADRLVAVNDLFTGSLVPVVSFSYDALGQRRSKTIYPSGLPLVTTEFVYDWRDDDSDGDIIEERVNGTLRRTYAVPHVFEQKGRVMFTGAGETYFFHTDELGNTLALTDASGTVVERCDYDDFGLPIFLSTDGLPTGETESGVGNPFLFRGMEWDAETGLYHDRGMSGENPLYDPQTGRVINNGMPNRISMNVTVGKQTQGATFGEKVNQGLHAAGGALNNPWSGSGPKAQDHNSSRSNKSGLAAPDGSGGGGSGGTKAQDHNSSRSNKTASIINPGGGGGGGGPKAQDHNSSRSNKSGLAGPGGVGGGGSRAQDHNSSRSNKSGLAGPGVGGGGSAYLCTSCRKHHKSGHVILLK